MKNHINFKLDTQMIETIHTYSEILKKDHNTILKEALELYFQNEQNKLAKKNQDDENSMTNLDYDEFWDGVDI